MLEIPDLRLGFVHVPYYVYAVNREGSTMTTSSLRLLACVTRIVRTHYAILKGRSDLTSRLLRRKIRREYLETLPRVYQFTGGDRSEAMRLFNEKGSPLPLNAKFIGPFMLLARNARNLYMRAR
jgi:hypothetical protein